MGAERGRPFNLGMSTHCCMATVPRMLGRGPPCSPTGTLWAKCSRGRLGPNEAATANERAEWWVGAGSGL